MTAFVEALAASGRKLVRSRPAILQINVGLACNLACKHCHLEAGPHRTELMDQATMDAVVAYASAFRFPTIDVTGGAPEMNPRLGGFLERLAPLTDCLMLRTNLVALEGEKRRELLDVLVRNKVAIVASLPSTRKAQTDGVRGENVHDSAVSLLQTLNGLGYGHPGSGLDLLLVANPGGAFLPADQQGMERRYRRELLRDHGVVFTRLLTFANVPLGRFRNRLAATGRLEEYLKTLSDAMNIEALDGVMCRELVSVAWDGRLYDCDFNQAARLPMAGRPHVSDLLLPPEGQPIATGDHCFACVAGSGFT